MAFLPRPVETAQPLSTRRALNHDDEEVAEDERLPEWRRKVRRMLRECEATRAHCRRQWEMIAAQREYLKGLNCHHTFAGGEAPAREEADTGRVHQEDTGDGE